MIINYRVNLISIFIFVCIITACNKHPFTDNLGKPVSLESDNGQWTVLSFWAEWCNSCRAEVVELNQLAQSGAVRVLGYDFDGDYGEALKVKVASMKIQFPVLQQSPLEKLKEKNPIVLPATYIISPDGEIMNRLYGVQTRVVLENQVRKLQLAHDG